MAKIIELEEKQCRARANCSKCGRKYRVDNRDVVSYPGPDGLRHYLKVPKPICVDCLANDPVTTKEYEILRNIDTEVAPPDGSFIPVSEEISGGRYFCIKCKRMHNTNTKNGRDHIMYKREGRFQNPKGRYHCKKCNKMHNINTKPGQDHWEHRRGD